MVLSSLSMLLFIGASSGVGTLMEQSCTRAKSAVS